jgi:hypothetical protein
MVKGSEAQQKAVTTAFSVDFQTIRKSGVAIMKVLIDGVEIEVLNDVKVIYEEQLIDVDPAEGGLDTYGQVHVTMNSEGMVIDVIEDGSNDIASTTWKMVEHMIEETH